MIDPTKFAALLLAVALLPLSVSSCKGRENQAYANTLTCDQLMEQILPTVPVDFGYEEYGDSHLKYFFNNTELPDGYCICYSVPAENINEIGIFHSPDESSRRGVEELAKDYLRQLLEDQESFIGSYAPEELPKLREAEVRSFGLYTVYAILDRPSRDLVFQAAEDALAQKK